MRRFFTFGLISLLALGIGTSWLVNDCVARQQEEETQAESEDSKDSPQQTVDESGNEALNRDGSSPAQKEDDGLSSDFDATHQETDVLKPTIEGLPVILNTFELDDQGNVWACVNLPKQPRRTARGKESSAADEPGGEDTAEDGSEAGAAKPKGYVLKYGPDKTLLRQIPLPFVPTAIDLDPSGTIYTAGEGKICKMTAEGKILLSSSTPNLAGKDIGDSRKEAVENYKKQLEATATALAKQKEQLNAKIAKIEAIKEEERTKRQLAQLKAYQQQVEQLDSFVPEKEIPDDMADYLIESKFRVPSLCVTSNYVFVTTSAKSGFAFSIWRTDTNFENPKEVIEQVSGCCGQMDVEADSDHFYVADNTKFNVSVYDLEGEKIDSFGKRAGKNDNGFGSCCNPMNVCCTKNGDLLTAESSIGKIKRFDSSGKMIGYVGKARIGAGCKHVALGYDEDRDRYYIQYQDKNHICVLVPNEQAAEKIAAQREKQARLDDAALPLVGRWIQVTSDEKSTKEADPKSSDADESESAQQDFSIDFDNLAAQVEQIEFGAHGDLKLKSNKSGGFLANYKALKWHPDEIAEDGTIVCSLEAEEVVMFRLIAKLESDDLATISIQFEEAGAGKNSVKFEREK